MWYGIVFYCFLFRARIGSQGLLGSVFSTDTHLTATFSVELKKRTLRVPETLILPYSIKQNTTKLKKKKEQIKILEAELMKLGGNPK